MGKNKRKSNIKNLFKLYMNHQDIDEAYNDLKAYDESKTEQFKTDIENIEYIGCDLIQSKDEAVDCAMNLMIERLAEYTKALLINEENEEYEYCQKLHEMIYIQKDLCYNYLRKNWDTGKYVIFHLNEIIEKFNQTLEMARRYNYNYNTAVKALYNGDDSLH